MNPHIQNIAVLRSRIARLEKEIAILKERKMTKKFEDLTPGQVKKICNGCRGKGSWVKPPHAVFFKSVCNKHDYSYWQGCTEADRKKADYGFYVAMVEDCNRPEVAWYNYARYRPWCWLYYKAVRQFGAKYFHFADKKREI